MKSRVVALPGEGTLIGSWTALTQLSPAARMINTSAATAAVFPSWAPLNNAILKIAPDDRAAEDAVSQLTACYAQAGVATWALWARGDITNLDAPDTGPEISGLQRDTTTLVMHPTLSSGRQLQEGVVRTSIATATRAGDEPVPSPDLEPPDDVPGLTGWVMLHESVAVASAWKLSQRARLRNLHRRNPTRVAPPRLCPRPDGTRARRRLAPWSADCEPAINADGRAFVHFTRLSGRRPV